MWSRTMIVGEKDDRCPHYGGNLFNPTEFDSLQVELTQQDMKVMMAVLRENLLEVSNKPEKVGTSSHAVYSDHVWWSM